MSMSHTLSCNQTVPRSTHGSSVNVGHFVKYGHISYILHGSLQEVLEVEPFLLTTELGSAAGVTSYPPQLFSIDTAGQVTDDILELFNGSGLELHYFVHSLRSDVEIKAW